MRFRARNYLTLVFVISFFTVILGFAIIYGDEDFESIKSILPIIAIFLVITFIELLQGRKIAFWPNSIKIFKYYSEYEPPTKGTTISYSSINKVYFKQFKNEINGRLSSKKERDKFPALLFETDKRHVRVFLIGFKKKQVEKMLEILLEKNIKIQNPTLLEEFHETKLTGLHVTHRRRKPLRQYAFYVITIVLFLTFIALK